MTWNRIAPSPVSITAWALNHPDPVQDRIQISLGSGYVHLDADDAESLAGYLLGHAQAIKDRRAFNKAAAEVES